MVQGQPAVDWKKPENNAKLFAAVLALFPGTSDSKKIAAVFGPNVPGNAIAYRLNIIRKEGAALGLTPGSGTAKSNGTATTTKRAAPTAKKDQLQGKGRKRRGILSDDPSDDAGTAIDSVEEESAAETDSEKPLATSSAKRQKTIGGRVIKRVSPRKSKKTDYKTLGDPFVHMDDAKDEKGNNVFGGPSGTDTEDTYATDGSFRASEQDVAVKVEEAV